MATPLFTFILPVRNGGSYVRDCMASILAQTISDFEVSVLENGSNDGTAEWLNQLQDPRVKIYPAPITGSGPLTIEENWNRALHIPLNEFISIIGHDDLLDPNYLEVMQELIARNPDARLYQAHFRLIDEQGNLRRSCTPQPERESAAEFLRASFVEHRDSYGTGYMMRATDYKAVGGIPLWPKLLYADDALWVLLMLHSWKATSPIECFSYRLHTTSEAGSAPITHWLGALRCYIPFLKRVSEEDPEIGRVYAEHGVAHFEEWMANILTGLLWDATSNNKKAAPELLADIFSTAECVDPGLPDKLRQSKRYRLRHLINQQGVLRRLYTFYIHKRFGAAKANPK